MNSNVIGLIFMAAASAVIWYAMTHNNPAWSGNQNACIGECYAAWQAENGGSIAEVEAEKQAALAAASPEALGKAYYGQCIACHGGGGEGGIGPMLSGQAHADIVSKLSAYRAGEQRGGQSAMMWPVAKPMSDADINNIAAYVTSL